MSIGRGLGALLTPTTGRKNTSTNSPRSGDSERVWLIPTNDIKPDPHQPRRHFPFVELEELAASIKEHGIVQPILVAEVATGGYQIIVGERRWRAAGLLKLPTVPAIVKTLSEHQKLEVALIENLQRADLNPMEEAFAFSRLIEEFGLTQEQVAQKVGKSRPVIANTIRLLSLPEEVQQALVEGKINHGQARALLAITNKAEQLEVLASMMGEKMTVRDLEREAAKRRPGGSPRRDPNLLYLEEKLRGTLGTKVSITQKGDRGTIQIAYFSQEELAELIKKIAG
ncbi:MAG: ParB/RepB/Spo0J family partition protein [Candidatus Magasanikbacteria bacterium]|nr:ParB/RepB/Spo0J family partition protein [Candidatus Magasanikbacteria bacterium]